MPRVEPYSVQEYEYLHITNKGRESFKQWLAKQNWLEVLQVNGLSAKAKALEQTLASGMKHAFEKKVQRKKSSEPPWMNEEIRRWIARRRAIFRRCGRNAVWRRLKKKTAAAIKIRKRGYTQHFKENFLSNGSPGGFYHFVKSVLNGNQAPKWEVHHMYPGEPDDRIAESLATYFNDISSQYELLRDDEIPTASWAAKLPTLSCKEVADKMISVRKPNSQVPGIYTRAYIRRTQLAWPSR